MNFAGISGRLVKVPEFQFQNDDPHRPFCTISIAVDKPFNAAQRHERERHGQPTADFFTVTGYDDPARFLKRQIEAGRLQPGTELEVTGSLEQRLWERDGQKRSVVAIRARDIRFAPQRRGGLPQSADPSPPSVSDRSHLSVADPSRLPPPTPEHKREHAPEPEPEPERELSPVHDALHPFLHPEDDAFNPFLEMIPGGS